MPLPLFRAFRSRSVSSEDSLEFLNRELGPLVKQLRDFLQGLRGSSVGDVLTMVDDGNDGLSYEWKPPEVSLDSLLARQVITASTLDPPKTVDFNIAYKATLYLDESIDELTIVPPTLTAAQAAHCSLVVIQTGAFTVDDYSENVIWAEDTPPTITTTGGGSDVLAFLADGDEAVMRGMYTGNFPVVP